MARRAGAWASRAPPSTCAFKGVEPDMSLPDLVLPGKTESDVKGQAEFTRTPAQYVNASYLAKLGRAGQGARRDQHATVARQDRAASSACSGNSCSPSGGARPRSARTARRTTPSRCSPRRPGSAAARTCSATSCCMRSRCCEDGVRTRETMNASWAGAMGLTQFMPSEFYTLAYDLDGDGTQGHLGLGAGRAGLRRQPAARQGLGCRARPGATRCACPRTAASPMEGPDNAQPVREWVKAGVHARAAGEFPAHALDAVRPSS